MSFEPINVEVRSITINIFVRKLLLSDNGITVIYMEPNILHVRSLALILDTINWTSIQKFLVSSVYFSLYMSPCIKDYYPHRVKARYLYFVHLHEKN